MAQLILIVEDEKDLIDTVSYALELEGWQTAVAYDGAAALEIASRQPTPDLVLLDLMLPDMLGTEVCRRMRSAPVTESVPIIILTACDSEVDRVIGFEVGADDYIGKPFSLRE